MNVFNHEITAIPPPSLRLLSQFWRALPPPLAFAQTAAPAAATPAPPSPAPSLEQRVAGLEAYLAMATRRRTQDRAQGQGWQPDDPEGLTTPSVGTSGPGHNAWQMTSAALVLFMTLPGLALFYGGLVRHKNVLSVMAQCLLLSALGHDSLVGVRLQPGLPQREFLPRRPRLCLPQGRRLRAQHRLLLLVSHNVFSMYQLMFAIITPALIVGAIAERMKFSAIFLS